MTTGQENKESLIRIEQQLIALTGKVDAIDKKMVTLERFRPVEATTYGMVMAALAVIVGVAKSYFSGTPT